MTKNARMTVLAYEDHAPRTQDGTYASVDRALSDFVEQAERGDLAIDWSTFTATPDEEEFDVTAANGGLPRKDSFSVLRYSVVAVKVED